MVVNNYNTKQKENATDVHTVVYHNKTNRFAYMDHFVLFYSDKKGSFSFSKL